MSRHGGARTGAGRPPLPDEDKRSQRCIYVPDEAWQDLLGQALQFDLTPGEYVEHLVVAESGRRAREVFEAARQPAQQPSRQ
jgi:hypothetical protein